MNFGERRVGSHHPKRVPPVRVIRPERVEQRVFVVPGQKRFFVVEIRRQ